jgi:hypothetical protein
LKARLVCVQKKKKKRRRRRKRKRKKKGEKLDLYTPRSLIPRQPLSKKYVPRRKDRSEGILPR